MSWILDLGWRQYVFGIWDLGSGIREGEKSVLASGINIQSVIWTCIWILIKSILDPDPDLVFDFY